MKQYQTLLIFILITGLLALLYDRIHNKFRMQQEEKKRLQDTYEVNDEDLIDIENSDELEKIAKKETFGIEAFTEAMGELVNDNNNDNNEEYTPKEIRFRGRGLNENGFNVNPEPIANNPKPVEWNTDNNMQSQTNILNKYKAHNSKYREIPGFDGSSTKPKTYLRNGDFLRDDHEWLFRDNIKNSLNTDN